MKKNLSKSMKNALIELYLSIKKFYNNDIKNKEDLEYLFKLDEMSLIKYIKDSIDIAISKLAEKKANEYNFKILKENESQDYESLLIKYEKDIRGHIKTENQLKLYADSLQNNIEELEKEKKELNDIINIKNNEINKIRKELNYLKKTVEIQKRNFSEIEKKIKNFVKLEKKYKNEIDSLNKKVNYYENLFMEDKENNEKGKVITNTIYCNSSRLPINSNFLKNEKENIIYRNVNNNFISYNNSISNSHPYVKKEKSIIRKIRKNNIYIPNNNNSFIIDSKVKHQTINKLIINDSSLNDNKKNKKIYHRHKSIENNSNKYIIRNKPLNIIKKILISSNNSTNNSFSNINKGFNNSYINFKNKINSNNNNEITINSSYNNFNKSDINNFDENIKNKKGCNCDLNINKLKEKNGIYIKTNIYRKSGNYSERELGYKKINNDSKCTHIHGQKELIINFRNKSKEKINSSHTTNVFFN